jgi:hypothetical protein
MERKHASLPRSTTVHSTPIPPKEQPLAASLKSSRPVSDEPCKNPWVMGGFSGNIPTSSQVSQVAKPGALVFHLLILVYLHVLFIFLIYFLLNSGTRETCWVSISL